MKAQNIFRQGKDLGWLLYDLLRKDGNVGQTVWHNSLFSADPRFSILDARLICKHVPSVGDVLLIET